MWRPEKNCQNQHLHAKKQFHPEMEAERESLEPVNTQQGDKRATFNYIGYISSYTAFLQTKESVLPFSVPQPWL